jgi:peptidoglycan/LPS O-acetylase OafA/YrhL
VKTLQSVQFLRGIAVLLVVLFHHSGFIERKYGLTPLAEVFRNGFAGMMLFFVLSGFIILTAHAGDLGRPARIGFYVGRRFIRIYPFYWLVLLASGGWRVFSGELSLKSLALNALLFKGTPSLIIPVSWTLAYEVVFYGLFIAFLINRKLGAVVFLIWLVSLAALWGGPVQLPWLIDPLYGLFLLGMATAWLVGHLSPLDDRWRDGIGWSALALGTAGFMATGYLYSHAHLPADAWPHHPLTLAGFGGSSALLLLASVSASVNQALGKVKWLCGLGNASYAIYLVHLQFGKLGWNLAKAAKLAMPGEPGIGMASVLLAWIVLFSLALGLVLHHRVEAPLLRWLRRAVA